MIPQKWQAPLFVAGFGALLWSLGNVLTPFVAAMMLAWLGNPLVSRLERAGRSRGTAVLIVYFATTLIILTGLLVLVPMLWHQMSVLLDGIPNLVAWFKDTALPWISEKLHRDATSMLDPTKTAQVIQSHWKEVGGLASVLLSYASRSSLTLLLMLSNMVLIPILLFYFLRDWPMLIQRIHDMLPRDLEPKISLIARDSNDVLLAFIRGQLLVMVLLGMIYALGLYLIGLDSGLLIGFIAGLVSFVPYLGAIVGVSAAIIASLIQYGDISHLLWVGLVFIIGQAIESYVLTPKLVGDRIGLHPVMVIFSIMAFGKLFGFIGVLLALPSAAVLNVWMKYAYQRYLRSRIYGETPVAPLEPPRPDV